MKIVCLSSGSVANCYILTSKETGHSIILDCGLRFRSITNNKLFCGFKNIDVVLVSHLHKDHSKSLKDFKLSGCNIVSYETLETGCANKFKFGQWLIQAFPVAHDVENWGFIIKDTITNKIICYVTDFYKMPIIEQVDFWIYEVNYDMETVEKVALSQTEDLFYTQNGFKNHNSLENAIEYFGKLKTKPKGIYVCHISDKHSNRKKIKRELSAFCNNIHILDKEKIYELKEVQNEKE